MIFSTRSECSFQDPSRPSGLKPVSLYAAIDTAIKAWSSPLVLSVILHLLHSFGVYFCVFSTRFECSFASFQLVWSEDFASSPLVSSVVLATMSGPKKLTFLKRLIWYRWGAWPVRSEKGSTRMVWKLHSKRVEKMKTTLETSGEDENYTPNERRRW